MKNIKITGTKKAIGEYKNWLIGDSRRRACIMMNKNTGEVWTDVFVDYNSWVEYHDENIVSLSAYIKEQQNCVEHNQSPITMQSLKEYAIKLVA